MAYMLVSILFIGIGIYGYLVVPSNPTGIFTFVIAGLLILSAVQRWTRPIRTASFFDDHVDLSGRKFRKRIQYSAITNLSTNRTPPKRNSTLLIMTKGDERTLSIMRNPTDKKLKVDLYTWLSERIDKSDTRQ